MMFNGLPRQKLILLQNNNKKYKVTLKTVKMSMGIENERKTSIHISGFKQKHNKKYLVQKKNSLLLVYKQGSSNMTYKLIM